MRRLLLVALLLFAFPAYAIDVALCDNADESVADGTELPDLDGDGTEDATRDGDNCLVIDPGNGDPDILIQYEYFHEDTVGNDCPGSTVDLQDSDTAKTVLIWDTIQDNYKDLSACKNKDVNRTGSGDGYSHEFMWFKDFQIINAIHCGNVSTSGPGDAINCTGDSTHHTDNFQLRGIPANDGWFIMQDGVFGNGHHIMLSQVGPFFGSMGSHIYQGLQVGNAQALGEATTWITDCLDRGLDPGLCEAGSFDIGNAPDELWIIDVWGSTTFSTNGDGGNPGKIVMVNTGCSETGCGGDIGYTSRGWPHPLGRNGTGPGTCPNGKIGSAPNTYCYTTIENALADNTCDVCPHDRPPMIHFSDAGWADSPGAGLGLTLSVSPSPVEVNQAHTLTAVPNGGTAPYTVTWDCDGDTVCDDGTPDSSSPYTQLCTAFATPGTRTLKACVTDDAAATATRTVSLIVNPVCGNGLIEGDEVCDPGPPEALDGQTCESQVGTGSTGNLNCSASCDEFDSSLCTPGVSSCGDGICSPTEEASASDGVEACFPDCAAFTCSIIAKQSATAGDNDYVVTGLNGGERINIAVAFENNFAMVCEPQAGWTDPNTGGPSAFWLDHTGPPGESNRDTDQDTAPYTFPGDAGPGGIEQAQFWTPPLIKGSHNFKVRPCTTNMSAASAAGCTGGGGVLGPELDVTLSVTRPSLVLGPPGKPFLVLK